MGPARLVPQIMSLTVRLPQLPSKAKRMHESSAPSCTQHDRAQGLRRHTESQAEHRLTFTARRAKSLPAHTVPSPHSRTTSMAGIQPRRANTDGRVRLPSPSMSPVAQPLHLSEACFALMSASIQACQMGCSVCCSAITSATRSCHTMCTWLETHPA